MDESLSVTVINGAYVGRYLVWYTGQSNQNAHSMYMYILTICLYLDMLFGGSNYDSLIVRTIAFPVQVAYWIKRS